MSETIDENDKDEHAAYLPGPNTGELLDDTSEEEYFSDEIIDNDDLEDLLEDQHGQEDLQMEEIID